MCRPYKAFVRDEAILSRISKFAATFRSSPNMMLYFKRKMNEAARVLEYEGGKRRRVSNAPFPVDSLVLKYKEIIENTNND